MASGPGARGWEAGQVEDLIRAIARANDSESLRAAEGAITEAACYPGFGMALIERLTADPPLPAAERQHIASVIKSKVIANHWETTKEKQAGAGVGTHHFRLQEEEKAALREVLPGLLSESDGPVRRIIASALGKLGSSEWPAVWPDFVEGLRSCIEQPVRATAEGRDADVNQWLAADGALECLIDVAASSAVDGMSQFATEVGPLVLEICSLPDPGVESGGYLFFMGLRTRALGVFCSMLEVLTGAKEFLKPADRKAAKLVVRHMAPPLLMQIGEALESKGWYPSACALKHAAFGALHLLVNGFADVSSVKEVLPMVVSRVISVGAAAMAEYVRVEVNGGEPEEAPGGEPKAGTIDAHADPPLESDAGCKAIASDFALFVSACTASTVKAAEMSIREHFSVAATILLAGAQISEDLLEKWEVDDEAYLEDEAGSMFNSSLRHDVLEAFETLFEIDSEVAGAGLVSLTCAAAAALEAASTPHGGPAPQIEHAGAAAALTHLVPLLAADQWKTAEAAIFLLGGVAPHWTGWKDEVEAAPAAAEKAAAKASSGQAPDEETQAKWAKQAENTAARATALTSMRDALALDPVVVAQQLVSLLQSGGEAVTTAENAAQARPYLLSRTLWCASRLAEMLPPEATGELMAAAVEGLDPSMAMPIRVLATESLSRLMRRAPQETVEGVAGTIITRVCEMTGEAAKSSSDNVGSLVRLINKAVAFAPIASGNAESTITPLLLALYIRFAKDPYICPLSVTGLTLMIMHDTGSVAQASIERIVPAMTSVLQMGINDAEERQAREAARAASKQKSGGKKGAAAAAAGAASGSAPDEGMDLFPAALRGGVSLLRHTVERIYSEHRKANPLPPAASNHMPIPPFLRGPMGVAINLMGFTTDGHLLAEIVRFISCSIRAFGIALLEPGEGSGGAAGAAAPPALSSEELAACISRAMSSNLTDTCATPAGPLATTIMRHLLPALPPTACYVLLDAVTRRMAMARESSTQARLASSVAYAIVADQSDSNDIVQHLCEELVPIPHNGPMSLPGKTEAPCLVVWARAVATYIDLITDQLAKNLLMAAASRVLTHRPAFALLTSVRVQGEAIETPAAQSVGVQTRNRRKVTGTELKRAEVPLSVRLLTTFTRTWISTFEIAMNLEEPDDDDDEEDEESDEDGDEGGEEDEAGDQEPAAAGRGEGRVRRNGPSPFVPRELVAGLLDDEDDDDDAAGFVPADLVQLSDMFRSGGGGGGDGAITSEAIQRMLEKRALADGGDSEEFEDDNSLIEDENPLGLARYELGEDDEGDDEGEQGDRSAANAAKELAAAGGASSASSSSAAAGAGTKAPSGPIGDPILSRLTVATAAAQGHAFLSSLVAASKPGGDAAAGALLGATAAQLPDHEERIRLYLQMTPPPATE